MRLQYLRTLVFRASFSDFLNKLWDPPRVSGSFSNGPKSKKRCGAAAALLGAAVAAGFYGRGGVVVQTWMYRAMQYAIQ